MSVLRYCPHSCTACQKSTACHTRHDRPAIILVQNVRCQRLPPAFFGDVGRVQFRWRNFQGQAWLFAFTIAVPMALSWRKILRSTEVCKSSPVSCRRVWQMLAVMTGSAESWETKRMLVFTTHPGGVLSGKRRTDLTGIISCSAYLRLWKKKIRERQSHTFLFYFLPSVSLFVLFLQDVTASNQATHWSYNLKLRAACCSVFSNVIGQGSWTSTS